MELKNHTFYFVKIPVEHQQYEEDVEGWEPNYYYRLRLLPNYEQLNFEDTCGRMVPIDFENLCEFRDTLNKVIDEIVVSSVGARYAVS